MPIQLHLSVHDIVDVLMRRGHLDTRIFNQATMLEGTRLHSLYQGQQGENYISEYPLDYVFYNGNYVFHVAGKADGVIIDSEGNITVEEIKTTVAELDEFIQSHGQWHLSQAMFYAFILMKQKNVKSCNIAMIYIRQQNSKEMKRIEKTYSLSEVEQFVDDLILRYGIYQKKIQRFKEERDETVAQLSFPYSSFRKGQEELMSFVESAVKKGKNVFVEAPTGIGKTLSVLYPTVKRFGEHDCDQIYYLTSKNSIKKVAMNALSMFALSGAKNKSIEFTAKENCCFNDKKGHCNPDECPFARNYYDKLFDATFDALEVADCFTREEIERFCFERGMCPFQFQLDLSHYCDVIVCDYSYVFDYHDRLGLNEGAFVGKKCHLLVDECHNLPDRVRDMYSIEIELKSFKEALTLCSHKEFTSLKKDIKDCLKLLEEIEVDYEDENVIKNNLYLLDSFSEKVLNDIYDVILDIKAILKKHVFLVTDPLLEFYYNLNSFYYLANLFNSSNQSCLAYVRLFENEITSIRIANLDSRELIKAGASFFASSVYFSATLSPKEYYIDLLGGDIQDLNNRLILPSPFSFENRRVYIDKRYSLKYRDRGENISQIFELILNAISQKKGNYFIFAPSFEYLSLLQSCFEQVEYADFDLFVQGRSMNERQREEFLEEFTVEKERTTIGLLVLGGVFSEGIDLIGDRLIGAIVLSIGIPQIQFERDRLKDYYDKLDEENKKGFAYAYAYPGINRVLQAAGRVIRSEEDKGFLLFIDSRFKGPFYRKLFLELYPDSKDVFSNSQVKNQLKLFWKDNQE